MVLEMKLTLETGAIITALGPFPERHIGVIRKLWSEENVTYKLLLLK